MSVIGATTPKARRPTWSHNIDPKPFQRRAQAADILKVCRGRTTASQVKTATQH